MCGRFARRHVANNSGKGIVVHSQDVDPAAANRVSGAAIPWLGPEPLDE